ncbi:hypothetical protein GBA52_004500 [Prunus armeniaca]|nr:hypothetical protein GBA52_004500 [Prunus armeniaca]
MSTVITFPQLKKPVSHGATNKLKMGEGPQEGKWQRANFKFQTQPRTCWMPWPMLEIQAGTQRGPKRERP